MSEDFPYNLIRSKRRSMCLSVDRSGVVYVKAPLYVSRKLVDNFVLSKIEWLTKVKAMIGGGQKVQLAESVHELEKYKLLARRLIIERIKVLNINQTFFYKKISIKNMTSRWGSCSSDGNLNFNYRLYFLPINIVDYVVVHELCHLFEHNHGRGFWALVENFLPDYREEKSKLKLYHL